MASVTKSWATDQGTQRSMLGNVRRDTFPELDVRRALHARGFRYRVDHPLPFDRRRRADILFTRQKVAVFIDGCFWHSCPEHATSPRTNTSYWIPKLRRNVERDLDTNRRLQDAGWLVLRFWEHEPVPEVVDRIAAAVTGGARS